MRVTRLGVLLAVAASALVLATGEAYAAQAHRRLRPEPRFHRIASSNVFGVAASGHYAFFLQELLGAPSAFGQPEIGDVATLIDERTGARSVLSPPDCAYDPWSGLFGGPWLAVLCPQGVVDLLDLSTRNWVQVTPHEPASPVSPPGPTCQTGGGSDVGCSLVGVGSDWLEFEFTEYHASNSYVLATIPSGALSGFQVTPGTPWAFDLNSPTGITTLCSPLVDPSFEETDQPTQPGWIDVLGRFAVVADNPPIRPTNYYMAYLARCGSQRRISLTNTEDLAASSRAIAWWTLGYIEGIRLPSLKRFKIAAPLQIDHEIYRGASYPWIALSATKVYVAAGGALWAAPLN